jgi:hypothetical protein
MHESAVLLRLVIQDVHRSVVGSWTGRSNLMVSSIGGETVFYPHDRRSAKEEIVVTPETGMLLLHKHGDDCMLVSATPPGARPMRWGHEYCAKLAG